MDAVLRVWDSEKGERMTRVDRVARWREGWEAFVGPKLFGVLEQLQAERAARIGEQVHVRVAVDFRCGLVTVECLRYPDGWRYRPSVTACEYPTWADKPFYKSRRRVQAMMEWRAFSREENTYGQIHSSALS